jgi:Arc/MetJ-type ribon-helix-helix transcriptional regulator
MMVGGPVGIVQLPDELKRVIERQVAEGRADSPAAFLEKAVRCLVDETRAEEDNVRQAAEAGVADIGAGRYTTVATQDDEQLLQERLMTKFRRPLSRSVQDLPPLPCCRCAGSCARAVPWRSRVGVST